MGLQLKDSPPGFDPSAIADNYGDYDDEFADSADLADSADDGRSLAEDEQL
jgi:DNA-directed RNA polymerase subunit alpha